jgi:microcystin-dependent protein
MENPMRKILISLLLILSAAITPAKEVLASTEPYLAEITIFAGNFPPAGFAFCDGQLLSIGNNTALFSLLGTNYGGDGRNNFALPDLREAEKTLGGVRYIIALKGSYPSRKR